MSDFDKWWSQHCENQGLTEIPWVEKHHARMAWIAQADRIAELEADNETLQAKLTR